jgi:hypothetical protein
MSNSIDEISLLSIRSTESESNDICWREGDSLLPCLVSSVQNRNGHITEFKPTLLVGVPAVWESIRKDGYTGKGQNHVFRCEEQIFECFSCKAFHTRRFRP